MYQVACERDSATGGRRFLLIETSEKLRSQDEQALQILALGKLQRHRVIGRGAEALDDLRLDARIERSARDDRLEERGVHAAGARERGEQPAGAQELERQQVDVLVRARGIASLRGGRRELRRI